MRWRRAYRIPLQSDHTRLHVYHDVARPGCHEMLGESRERIANDAGGGFGMRVEEDDGALFEEAAANCRVHDSN